jgi:hypothetical protein
MIRTRHTSRGLGGWQTPSLLAALAILGSGCKIGFNLDKSSPTLEYQTATPAIDLSAGSVEPLRFSAANRDDLNFGDGFRLSGSRGEVVSAILRLPDSYTTCKDIKINTAAAVGTFFKIKTFTTTQPSFQTARVGDYLDPLVPTTQACPGDLIWSDLTIPTSAAAGSYVLPYGLNLTIWKMTMPAKPTMPLYINLSGYQTMLAHGVANNVTNQGSLTRAYVNAYRAHRVEPFGHMVTVYPALNGDGTLNLDQWSANGASYRQLVLDGAIAPPMLFIPNPGNAPSINLLTALDAAIVAGTIPTGSMAYVWDEGEGDPSATASALARAQLVKQNAPHINVMTTRRPDPAFDPYVDTYFPVLDVFTTGWSKAYGLYTSCMAQGSCTDNQPRNPTGTPMMLIDAPTVHPRAFLWVNYKLGAKSTLYYNATEKLSSAWTNQYFAAGNGDGTLIYPDKTALTPDMSIRMKMLRQGSFDLEYLNWAKASGIGYVDPVTDERTWSQSFDSYQETRDRLGTQLDAI